MKKQQERARVLVQDHANPSYLYPGVILAYGRMKYRATRDLASLLKGALSLISGDFAYLARWISHDPGSEKRYGGLQV